jgi:hypothetical protein
MQNQQATKSTKTPLSKSGDVYIAVSDISFEQHFQKYSNVIHCTNNHITMYHLAGKVFGKNVNGIYFVAFEYYCPAVDLYADSNDTYLKDYVSTSVSEVQPILDCCISDTIGNFKFYYDYYNNVCMITNVVKEMAIIRIDCHLAQKGESDIKSWLPNKTQESKALHVLQRMYTVMQHGIHIEVVGYGCKVTIIQDDRLVQPQPLIKKFKDGDYIYGSVDFVTQYILSMLDDCGCTADPIANLMLLGNL